MNITFTMFRASPIPPIPIIYIIVAAKPQVTSLRVSYFVPTDLGCVPSGKLT